MSDKLPTIKDCPFCGHERAKVQGKRIGNSVRIGTRFQVVCNKCRARGPIIGKDHPYKADGLSAEHIAILLWNDRI